VFIQIKLGMKTYVVVPAWK